MRRICPLGLVDDRAFGAGRFARTAIDALIGIDTIDRSGIACADRALRTFIFATATTGALLGDFIGHKFILELSTIR